jgi:hypothetical protein
MNMHRSDIPRIVDRHRTAHRAGDLQPPAEPRIGQQKLLALGKFDRRDVGAARDLGDFVEIGRDLVPAPAVRDGL